MPASEPNKYSKVPDFNTMHMIQSGGASLDSTTAKASDIFKNKTAYNGNGDLITGTYSFPSTTASAGDIFKGKTAINSSGSVITGTYSFPTVNVTAGNMMSGTTAINSSGSVVKGTIVNRGSPAATLSVGGSKSYSAGYYSAGTVKVNSLPSTSASAADIKKGKVALNSSGNQITGTHTEPTLHTLLIGTYSDSDSSISINISSKVSVYRSLSVNNFFIELYGCTCQAGAFNQSSANGSATQTKNYNASTGVFTASSCTAPATAPNIAAYGKPMRKVYVVWVA